MKKYELLKDLLTIRAGAILKDTSDEDGRLTITRTDVDSGEIIIVSDFIIHAFKQMRDDPTDIFDEWFEEIKENKIWAPNMREPYYFIRSAGRAVAHCEYEGDEVDVSRILIGNCFETADDAERAIKKLAALQRLRRRGLKFDGFTAPCESKVCARKHEGITRFMLDSTLVDSETFKDLELLFGKEE